MDETDSATFVIFDRDATILFNKSCSEMFEMFEKKGSEWNFPKEILELVNRSFIFKVDFKSASSSAFDQSFRVKKICSDLSVMNQFKEALVAAKVPNFEDSPMKLPQDLMKKFSDEVGGLESQMDEKETTDLTKDVEDVTPLKKTILFTSLKKVEGGKVSLISTPPECRSVTQVKEGHEECTNPESLTPIQSVVAFEGNDSKAKEPIQSVETIDKVVHLGKEPVQEVEVPLKLLKKKIKVEKN